MNEKVYLSNLESEWVLEIARPSQAANPGRRLRAHINFAVQPYVAADIGELLFAAVIGELLFAAVIGELLLALFRLSDSGLVTSFLSHPFCPAARSAPSLCLGFHGPRFRGFHRLHGFHSLHGFHGLSHGSQPIY